MKSIMSQGATHKPSSDSKSQVSALSGFGIPQAEVAKFLDISKPTLRKHYRDELNQGGTTANVKVIKSLFDNAVLHNNVAAQIFWAKVRCGWSETSIHQHTGADGGSIKVDTPTLDVTGLSLSTLKEIRAAMLPADPDTVDDAE
jgi:hypothetical protein